MEKIKITCWVFYFSLEIYIQVDFQIQLHWLFAKLLSNHSYYISTSRYIFYNIVWILKSIEITFFFSSFLLLQGYDFKDIQILFFVIMKYHWATFLCHYIKLSSAICYSWISIFYWYINHECIGSINMYIYVHHKLAHILQVWRLKSFTKLLDIIEKIYLLWLNDK